MAALTFVLECAALAALSACVTSAVGFALWMLLTRVGSRLSSSRRADLALLLSLAPAVATLGVVAATALPPLFSSLGLGPADDCFTHLHHGHFCLVHLGSPRPALMVLGVAALAVTSVRALLLATTLGRAWSDVSLLETLGHVKPAEFPIVWVPGAPRLCLATGVLRRRILVSQSLSTQLAPAQLAAALAHERAHLRRHDPLVSLLVQLSGLAVLPGIAGALARAHAGMTEEACDEDAAHEVGEPAMVAEALVRVAALASQRGPALAFGRGALEARVTALLRLSLAQRAPVRLPLLLGTCAASALSLALILSQSEAVHDAVESLLHGFL